MNICRFLQSIYGRDTRAAQVINILLSGLWAITLYLHSRSFLLLELPETVQGCLTDTLIMALLATIFGVVGLVTKGRRHQIFKFFGLSLGAVFYGVLANGYFSAYPPLEMMLVICVALVVWFSGGLLYIVQCEGLDGKYTSRS